MAINSNESKILSEVLIENYNLRVENENLKQMNEDMQANAELLCKEFASKEENYNFEIEELQKENNELKENDYKMNGVNRWKFPIKSDCISFSFNKKQKE